MNREQYSSDPRYAKVLEQMDLLKITDVSTTRQSKNGTIVWKLPVKHPHGGQLIKVASFKSGYVRNQNCCYSNYQLNKCKPNTEYYKDYKWNEECTEQIFTGKYRKYTGVQRILIPIEIDRLEYLIAFCLKNYYITYANHVANGDFVTKWRHEWDLKQVKKAESEWLVPKHKYDELVGRYGDLSIAHEDEVLKNKQKEKEFNGVRDVSITIDGMKYKVM